MQLTKNVYINYIITLIIQYVWSLMDDLSFLMINTMISMSIPGVASIISDVLINLIYFDILFTERWFPQFMESMNFEFDFNDQAINTYFEQNGFQSLLILKNLGSTLFFIIFYFMAWFLILILKIVSMFCETAHNLAIKLESKLMWNGTISLIIQQFAPMIISSFINFY